MLTELYFIRHGESPFVYGKEKERGLSEDGLKKSQKIADALCEVEFSCIVSSSYKRAIDTVLPLAKQNNMIVETFDELVERPIKGLDYQMEWSKLEEGIKLSFTDVDYSLPGGESTKGAQLRSIPVIENLLFTHYGKAIAIGTHGNIMTIILNYYDSTTYGYEFWKSTSKPDIYKASFDGNTLKGLTRVDF
ncbi:MAG: histidine phosphatase family protein [Candidatus Delongbacteria bacterium]|jgi:2,3-bisphosphoglycerate-dependent phosphoglycerate mutase|nr:histidine phosphatase family protein [Candidatus Delongbacteria bacterium]